METKRYLIRVTHVDYKPDGECEKQYDNIEDLFDYVDFLKGQDHTHLVVVYDLEEKLTTIMLIGGSCLELAICDSSNKLAEGF